MLTQSCPKRAPPLVIGDLLLPHRLKYMLQSVSIALHSLTHSLTSNTSKNKLNRIIQYVIWN